MESGTRANVLLRRILRAMGGEPRAGFIMHSQGVGSLGHVRDAPPERAVVKQDSLEAS